MCVFTLLHDARPVLLDLSAPGGFDISGFGEIESGWSTPGTMACGRSARRGAPGRGDPTLRTFTDMSPGQEASAPDLPRARATWFGAALRRRARQPGSTLRPSRRPNPLDGGLHSRPSPPVVSIPTARASRTGTGLATGGRARRSGRAGDRGTRQKPSHGGPLVHLAAQTDQIALTETGPGSEDDEASISVDEVPELGHRA